MHDRRLLGLWKSDARRTRRDLRARRDIGPKTQRVLSRLFGRLELRYTRTRCHSTLDGSTFIAPYVVVAKDASSVAIVSRDVLGEEAISHVHFEGSRFWVPVGRGLFREFFKRVEPATGLRKPSA
jgi:hypothetical protein